MDRTMMKAAIAWLNAQIDDRKASRAAPKDAAETIEGAFARRYYEAELDREVALLEAIRVVVVKEVTP